MNRIARLADGAGGGGGGGGGVNLATVIFVHVCGIALLVRFRRTPHQCQYPLYLLSHQLLKHQLQIYRRFLDS